MIDAHDQTFLQQIRREHCAHAAKGSHACLGTCSISPTGVMLSCPACGDEKLPLAPEEKHGVTEHAKAILAAAGLDWDALSPMRQRSVVVAASRLLCPGCGSVHTPTENRSQDSFTCEGCGAWSYMALWNKRWEPVKRS